MDAAAAQATPARERSAASAARSKRSTSVSTSNDGNSATRPPLSITASARPSA